MSKLITKPSMHTIHQLPGNNSIMLLIGFIQKYDRKQVNTKSQYPFPIEPPNSSSFIAPNLASINHRYSICAFVTHLSDGLSHCRTSMFSHLVRITHPPSSVPSGSGNYDLIAPLPPVLKKKGVCKMCIGLNVE